LLLGPVSSSRCSRLAWSRVSACIEWVGATWRNVSNQSAGMPWKTDARPRGGARYLAPSDAKLLASKIGTLMSEVVVCLHRRVEVGIDNECAVLVRDHLCEAGQPDAVALNKGGIEHDGVGESGSTLTASTGPNCWKMACSSCSEASGLTLPTHREREGSPSLRMGPRPPP
jgi:hypothetical protein